MASGEGLMVCGRTYKRMEDASHSVQKSDHRVHERLRVILTAASDVPKDAMRFAYAFMGAIHPSQCLQGVGTGFGEN
jgi:hypothetical protein